MSWANEYYEIMEFYFSEPQHLGCIRKAGNTLKLNDVLSSLRQKEVPLNHIFNIGLHMLPSAMLVKLLGHYTAIDETEYVLEGGDILHRYKTIYPQFENFSQPDIFLSSPTQNVFIELKVSTKTSSEQYLKYLFLHALDEKYCGHRKKAVFFYSAPGDFTSVTKEKFASPQDFLASVVVPDILSGRSIREYALRMRELLNEGNLHYLSFAEMLQGFDRLKTEADAAAGLATFRNVLEGMTVEFQRRATKRS